MSTSPTGVIQWSAYRLHDADPFFFRDGLRFEWRNGDVLEPNGIKCRVKDGKPVGKPDTAYVNAYSWVYAWPN